MPQQAKYGSDILAAIKIISTDCKLQSVDILLYNAKFYLLHIRAISLYCTYID